MQRLAFYAELNFSFVFFVYFSKILPFFYDTLYMVEKNEKKKKKKKALNSEQHRVMKKPKKQRKFQQRNGTNLIKFKI